jgi:anti-sigma regulatory factor (Ser/Thr protein kinase)
MAEAAVRESVTVAGRAERARVVRAFVAGVLGPGHPYGDVVVLLVSELAANSVRHSDSGRPGGTLTVTVITSAARVRVEVTDDGGPGQPRLRRAPGSDAEDSRGLLIVDALASHWGHEHDGSHGTTWFEVQALLRPMQHFAVSGKGLNSPDEVVSGS